MAKCDVDGILSTKGQLIRFAKEQGLFAVQHFFVVDTAGAEGLEDAFHSTNPNLMEIMPGVVTKIIRTCASKGIPVIAGGASPDQSRGNRGAGGRGYRCFYGLSGAVVSVKRNI